jgi:hypothetical protein
MMEALYNIYKMMATPLRINPPTFGTPGSQGAVNVKVEQAVHMLK